MWYHIAFLVRGGAGGVPRSPIKILSKKLPTPIFSKNSSAAPEYLACSAFRRFSPRKAWAGGISTEEGMGTTNKKMPFYRKKGARFLGQKKRVAVFISIFLRPYSVRILKKRNLQGILARPGQNRHMIYFLKKVIIEKSWKKRVHEEGPACGDPKWGPQKVNSRIETEISWLATYRDRVSRGILTSTLHQSREQYSGRTHLPQIM